MAKKVQAKNVQLNCSNCGGKNEVELKTRGSRGVEQALWLCFLGPGFIYSMWRRLCGKIAVCPSCGKVTPWW